MKLVLAATFALTGSANAFVVTSSPSKFTSSSLMASEKDILEIVDKMPRLDAGEKENLKSLLYKAGDVHPDAKVPADDTVLAAVADETSTQATSDETFLMVEETPVDQSVEVPETTIEANLVAEETPVEETEASISSEPVAEEVTNETLVSEAPSMEVASTVDTESVSEQMVKSLADAAEQVQPTAEVIKGEDTTMLADLVTDVVNTSSDVVETVSAAISQLS